MTIFKRQWSLQIDDLLIQATTDKPDKVLEMEFNVSKSSTREPNTAEIAVYMLQKTNRDKIASSKDVTVTLKVGYEGQDLAQIFSGKSRHAYNEWDNGIVATKVECDDGGTSFRNAVVSASFGPDTSVLTVLKKAVESLGVGEGNLSDIPSVTLRNGESTYRNGTAIHGRARNVVDRIVRSCGLRWSIQDGVFQLREAGKPIVTKAISLKSSTGLVGSPRRTENHDGKPPVVEVDSLILPGFYPGKVIVLESREVEGNFRISTVAFTGSSSGQWLAKLTMKEY